jgi:hypothetical protein
MSSPCALFREALNRQPEQRPRRPTIRRLVAERARRLSMRVFGDAGPCVSVGRRMPVLGFSHCRCRLPDRQRPVIEYSACDRHGNGNRPSGHRSTARNAAARIKTRSVGASAFSRSLTGLYQSLHHVSAYCRQGELRALVLG